jgi:HD-GYP domain-containing protein (c-di-GMP phosphodiesterase class II)/pSer/pThr/pTyr-binding forkhead associated (FHA) protein
MIAKSASAYPTPRLSTSYSFDAFGRFPDLAPLPSNADRMGQGGAGVKRIIRLRGMNGDVKGRTWESCELLRIGRLESLEIALDDTSVSRHHAEIRATERGWRVRDLGSTNGTRLNGVRLTNGQWPLRVRDMLQFGEVAIVVEAVEDSVIQDTPAPSDYEITPPPPPDMRVEGATRLPWDQAIDALAFDANRCPRAGEQFLALLRAGHHLGHIEQEDELLRSVLEDAVSVLDAQRGAIVLAESPGNHLQLRSLVTGRNEPRAAANGRPESSTRFPFSQSLAQRSFKRGESVLCQRVEDDEELSIARSIAEGAMASVLCVLLRTPRKRLGVLHLDRSPWQKPFTLDDLHLADGLAANVSAGIECAQLLRKQRDLFLDTITVLAQAVEMRDQYTGGHTLRVSMYAVLLAEHLKMTPAEVELVRIGTPLHDIGKIGIDDAILRKPDRLTPEEFEAMKLHTIKGSDIIDTVPDLQPIKPIVRSHHERWDGKGYPDGLSGEAIPKLARVVALADAFDAMTSDRPYRKGLAPAAAFAEIEMQAGRQFDPQFAAVFVAMRDKLLNEMQDLTTAERDITQRHSVLLTT